MKKLILAFLVTVIVLAPSTVVHAESESGDSLNNIEATEDQIRENEAAKEEKEAILREAGLLIETSDLIALQGDSVLGNLNTMAAGYYTSKKLAVKRVQQENDYYCGPASAKMILDYKGIVRSQSTIANAVGTTSSNGTGIYNLATYLKNQTGFSYVAQSISSRPIANVKATIDSNYPVIYLVMSKSINDKYTFNGGHYVTGHGYRLYTDPNISPSSLPTSDTLISIQPTATVYSVLTDLYYYDPWKDSYAQGEKTITVKDLTNAINANQGLYIW